MADQNFYPADGFGDDEPSVDELLASARRDAAAQNPAPTVGTMRALRTMRSRPISATASPITASISRSRRLRRRSSPQSRRIMTKRITTRMTMKTTTTVTLPRPKSRSAAA